MEPSDIPNLFWKLGTVAVAGDSMEPTFAEGDWLLVRWTGPFKTGQVVVVEQESRPGVFLIKRLINFEGGKYWVEGDNQSKSTDSRQWGALDASEVRGRILMRIRKVNSKRGRHRAR